MLTAAKGKHEAVEADLRQTTERFIEMGYPYWEAMARLDLAYWLTDRGRTDEADALANAAAVIFERLGAAPDLDRARRLGASAVVT